jgi:hypothetical protein
MSGQTVRNHRDRPRHIPTVNAGPSGSGIQAGLHKLLYFVVFESSSDDVSQIKTQVMVPVLPLMNLRRVMTLKGTRDQRSEHDGRANYQYVNIYK